MRQYHNKAIREQVVAAVIDCQGSATKTQIVERFLPSGVPRSTLYTWVARALDEDVARRVAHAVPIMAGHVMQKQGDVREEQGIKMMMAAAKPTPEAIPFLERLQVCLHELDATLAISKREDGTIRNVNLVLQSIDLIGRTLERAARIQESIQDYEINRSFMRSLADVIFQEETDVRDRIVVKMRALGHGMGGDGR